MSDSESRLVARDSRSRHERLYVIDSRARCNSWHLHARENEGDCQITGGIAELWSQRAGDGTNVAMGLSSSEQRHDLVRRHDDLFLEVLDIHSFLHGRFVSQPSSDSNGKGKPLMNGRTFLSSRIVRLVPDGFSRSLITSLYSSKYDTRNRNSRSGVYSQSHASGECRIRSSLLQRTDPLNVGEDVLHGEGNDARVVLEIALDREGLAGSRATICKQRSCQSNQSINAFQS